MVHGGHITNHFSLQPRRKSLLLRQRLLTMFSAPLCSLSIDSYGFIPHVSFHFQDSRLLHQETLKMRNLFTSMSQSLGMSSRLCLQHSRVNEHSRVKPLHLSNIHGSFNRDWQTGETKNVLRKTNPNIPL